VVSSLVLLQSNISVAGILTDEDAINVLAARLPLALDNFSKVLKWIEVQDERKTLPRNEVKMAAWRVIFIHVNFHG
jgi:hypothetical protein